MFKFKRFAVEQDRTSMKVGTDGVLLGAWVDVRGCEGRILDIGTGTGVIALMMAQRVDDESVTIDTVEIDTESAEQARENIERSDWSKQLTVHNVGIQNFKPEFKYDLIVSNPPYFVDSLLSPNRGRTTARHTTELSFRELVEAVERLLSDDGRFALILPAAESQLFDKEADGVFRLIRRCSVLSRAGGAVKRYMSEYCLVGCDMVSKEDESIVIYAEQAGEYTAEYKELTRDFYLKF